MRREGVSASKAARDEGLKLKTFRKGAGRFLYRSGPGKPWKARSEDQLRFLMTVITDRGPLEVVVSNSRERKVLSQYNFALRMFRAGEDGADAALKEFEGKRVGGQTLLTDIKLLIEQEEVGNLDFEGFYVPIGAASWNPQRSPIFGALFVALQNTSNRTMPAAETIYLGSKFRFVKGTMTNFTVCSTAWELTFATHPISLNAW
jgi:hypothetical protein